STQLDQKGAVSPSLAQHRKLSVASYTEARSRMRDLAFSVSPKHCLFNHILDVNAFERVVSSKKSRCFRFKAPTPHPRSCLSSSAVCPLELLRPRNIRPLKRVLARPLAAEVTTTPVAAAPG